MNDVDIAKLVELTAQAGPALLAVIVALIAVRITAQQARTEEARRRFELFDRRYAIFEATGTYLALLTARPSGSMKDSDQFVQATRGALFLFGTDIDSFISEIFKVGAVIVDCTARLNAQERADGTVDQRIYDRREAAQYDAGKLFNERVARFAPYLSIESPKRCCIL